MRSRSRCDSGVSASPLQVVLRSVRISSELPKRLRRVCTGSATHRSRHRHHDTPLVYRLQTPWPRTVRLREPSVACQISPAKLEHSCTVLRDHRVIQFSTRSCHRIGNARGLCIVRRELMSSKLSFRTLLWRGSAGSLRPRTRPASGCAVSWFWQPFSAAKPATHPVAAPHDRLRRHSAARSHFMLSPHRNQVLSV